MWRRMTGQHKCSTCGQFLPESGGHACPGPAASTTTAGSPPTPPGQGQPVTGPIPGQPSPGQGQPSPNPNPDPQPSPQPSVAPSMDSEPPIRGRDRAALGWGVGWRSGIGVGAVALTAGTVFAPFMLPGGVVCDLAGLEVPGPLPGVDRPLRHLTKTHTAVLEPDTDHPPTHPGRHPPMHSPGKVAKRGGEVVAALGCRQPGRTTCHRGQGARHTAPPPPAAGMYAKPAEKMRGMDQ
jgi:Predicted membrane protein